MNEENQNRILLSLLERLEETNQATLASLQVLLGVLEQLAGDNLIETPTSAPQTLDNPQPITRLK